MQISFASRNKIAANTAVLRTLIPSTGTSVEGVEGMLAYPSRLSFCSNSPIKTVLFSGITFF
jgi:hypothetical protein